MRAKSLEFTGPRRVEIVDVDVPDPRGDEVLVRTLYSGISTGTELLAYRGQIPPDMALDETIGSLGGTFSYPFRFGYSCAGVVESGALPRGMNVFVLHPHQTAFVCPARDAVPVSAEPRAATLFPLVETALQITIDAGTIAREEVVVFGLGPVGLLTAILLQRSGARVCAVEPQAWRREVGLHLDVESVESSSEAPSGVPLVIEASGNPRALAEALPLLAHEGTALVASWYGAKPVTLDLGSAFHRRRLTIRSTQVSSIPSALSARWTMERRRAETAALMADLPLKKLATHEFAFANATDAFAALDAGQDPIMHAALAY